MMDFGPILDLLLVQAGSLESFPALGLTALPFEPVRLIGLVAWVYLCMFCVQRVLFGALVPVRH